MRDEQSGYVYFLKRRDGAIKIGTSVDVSGRIKYHASKHGYLLFLGSIPGSFSTEQSLHDKFIEHRIDKREEWFSPAPELMDWIHANAIEYLPEEGNAASKRIPVRPDTHADINDFKHGMGSSTDEAIRFMFHLLLHTGEKPLHAGRRLRKDFEIRNFGGNAN